MGLSQEVSLSRWIVVGWWVWTGKQETRRDAVTNTLGFRACWGLGPEGMAPSPPGHTSTNLPFTLLTPLSLIPFSQHAQDRSTSVPFQPFLDHRHPSSIARCPMLLITKCNPGLGPARSHTLQTQQQRVPHRCLHSGVIANAQPTGRKATQPRCVHVAVSKCIACVGPCRLQSASRSLLTHSAAATAPTPPPRRTVSPDDAAPSIASKQQPNWTEGMARIQGLMGRVQDQLQALSKLRLSSNPALLTELRDKAEQHLEVLMLLAESQQKQHIEDSSGGSSSKAASSSSSSKDLQRLLKELEQQLDLEHQAMVTAVASATSTPSSTPDPQQQGPNTTSSSSSRRRTKTQSQAAAGTTADPTTTQQPAAADAAAAVLQQQRLADAESKVTKLQRQLEDAEYVIQATADELSEHRELQMAYDKQCQDLYRLRMQLQLVRTQGHDAASVAAHANKQHKQVRACVAGGGRWCWLRQGCGWRSLLAPVHALRSYKHCVSKHTHTHTHSNHKYVQHLLPVCIHPLHTP